MEFLLLIVPMFGLASATIGIAWYGFAKSQLTQIAAESALVASKPDSSEVEVQEGIGEKLSSRLGVTNFLSRTTNVDGIASVSIELPDLQFLGPLSLVFPGLSVVSYAPSEI